MGGGGGGQIEGEQAKTCVCYDWETWRFDREIYSWV